MAKLQEDRVVLQAKFQNVDRLLQAYGDQILKLEAKLHTLFITHADVPGELLLQAAKDAAIPISELGIDQSLIEDDLLRCQTNLGADFGPWFRDCFQLLGKLQARCVEAPAEPDASPPLSDSWDFVAAAIAVLKMSIEPARLLRQQLGHQLNLERKDAVETAGHFRRRQRDDSIRLLAKKHNTSSPARVMKLAATDPMLRMLKGHGVKLTLDIVRNVVSPRKSRKTRARSRGEKIPVKRKNQNF